MSQTEMESIFTKIIYEIFWSQETIMRIIKTAEYTQLQLTLLALVPWNHRNVLSVIQKFLDTWVDFVDLNSKSCFPASTDMQYMYT